MIYSGFQGAFSGIAEGAGKLGFTKPSEPFFDTVTLACPSGADATVKACADAGMNIRRLDADRVSLSFDETTTPEDVDALFAALNGGAAPDFSVATLAPSVDESDFLARSSAYLQHPVFNAYHSEHEMVRYLA